MSSKSSSLSSSATISKTTSTSSLGMGFFETSSRIWLMSMFFRSLYLACWKNAYSMQVPELIIPTCRPFWRKCSRNWSRVMSSTSNRDQILSSLTTSPLAPLYSVCGLAMGSLNPKKGSARLTKPFLYCSISSLPSTTLYSSRVTRPVTRAVVVAMAGMIFPAINLVLCRSAGSIL